MATEKKDTKPPISGAPVAIVTPVAPSREVALKSSTHSRYKAENPGPRQNGAIPESPPKTVEEIAEDRYKQMIMLNGHDLTSLSLTDWIKTNLFQLGADFNPNDKIDRSYAQFLQANPNDREITAAFEAHHYSPLVLDPRFSSHGGYSTSPNAIIDDGFKTPGFKLDKHQARTALAADIKTVSDMYAADAGMSPKDFAKVMGGIATIESNFGVFRSVKGAKYASSAGGAFHYLDGTIAGEVRQSSSDPRISSRVNMLGVNIKDGVTKSEAWSLKDDNILAGSILAKRIIDTVRKNPELKDDIAALTTRVYQSHNLGEAGANALARGGRRALEAMDHRADDNNPMFFRGASSDTEINNRYKKYVSGAVASVAPLIAEAFADPSPLALQDKKPIRVATAPSLPGREPS